MREFSFFEGVRLPYYIYAYSFDFTANSAGKRALHYLCHALNELGAEAYLIGCSNESEFLRTPLLKKSDVLRHRRCNTVPIIVYPEVVLGNPLNMPFIARWLLNQAGHLGGAGTFDDTELLFAYNALFISEGVPATLLSVPVVNDRIFNNINNPDDNRRSGCCFYAHKYLVKGCKLTKEVEGAESLCQDVLLAPKEIAAVLRRSEVLYCYEPSAIIAEALLCGCPVVMVPTPFLEKNLPNSVVGSGISLSLAPEDIVVAKNTVHLVAEKNRVFVDHCREHVEDFINITQSTFSVRQSADGWVDFIFSFLDSVNELAVKKRRQDNLIRVRGQVAVKFDAYALWQECRVSLPRIVGLCEKNIAEGGRLPLFHFIIILNQGEENLLANTIDSLAEQIYSNWHLTIISDSACPDAVFEEQDALGWIELEANESPYDVINSSISRNNSDWFCLLEPGATIGSDCLATVVHYSYQNNNWNFIYTDEDQINKEGERVTPQFKPDFNLDLLRSSAYIGRFCFIKTEALKKLGGFYAMPSVENYDLAFQVFDSFGEQAIGHIPDVLGHKSYDSTREFNAEMGLRTLANHMQRNNIDASVNHSEITQCFSVNYNLNSAATVSILIPVKDKLPLLKACINSIIDTTSYQYYEIIIVNNQSIEQETRDYFIELKQLHNKLKIVEYSGHYNSSAMINLAAKQAQSDYLVLLACDTMVLQAEWLQRMLAHAQRQEIGIVGVKLVSPSKKLQHIGYVLGLGDDGIAGSPLIGKSMGDKGYMNQAMLVREVSAVSGACLMLSKQLYDQAEGLNEAVDARYNDIELCLRVNRLDYKVVWTPYVTLIHHGKQQSKVDKNSQQKIEDNKNTLLGKWLPQLANDKYYNRNLSLKDAGFRVDTSLNSFWNMDFKGKPKIYAFPGDSSGVGQYRVRGPLAALTNAGEVESSLANNFDELVYPTVTEIERINPDVLLSQNSFLDDSLTPWKQYRKYNDTFMVSGLDDLVYMLPQYHPKQGKWPSNTRRKVKELFQNSDRVIVANDALAEEFSKMAGDIVVVPNYLENWRWDSLNLPEKRNGKKLRVGWAGGQEHIADLEFIRPVVEALHKEVDWIFMGLCLDGFQPYIKENYAGVDFDHYPQLLANLNLDLAIAPLTHNKFNECKTNLRLLEYGMVGWPVVCTDILPYQNAPVTRVGNNTNEWIRVIREKINEPEALLREGKLLQQWVIDNYMLNDHVDEWSVALLP